MFEIHSCALKGDVEKLRHLIKEQKNKGKDDGDITDLAGQLDNHGAAPLHYAAMLGHAQMIGKLVAIGALPSVEVKESKKKIRFSLFAGAIPLHFAAMFGHAEAADVLIEKGRIYDRPMCGGFTPLHLAAEGKQTKKSLPVADAVVYSGVDSDELESLYNRLSAGDYEKTISVLLKAGADITRKNESGETAADIVERKHGKDAEVTVLLREAAERQKSKLEEE